MGPRTFVPISWFCKKQGSITHSSTEAELIALDAAVGIEGIPALALWELVINVFHPRDTLRLKDDAPVPLCFTAHEILLGVDHVPHLFLHVKAEQF